MLASNTSRQLSAVCQSSTKDGHTLQLTRSVLTQIISNLKQTGLEHLVHSIRSNNKSSLESAVVSAIAQVVNHATASGTVSSRTFGRNLRTFTAIGKTRKYQVLTQPIDNKQSAIVFVRSHPIQEFNNEYESEYEGEGESEYEGEYEGEYEFSDDDIKRMSKEQARQEGVSKRWRQLMQGNTNKKRAENRNQDFGGETHVKSSKKGKTGRTTGQKVR